MRGITLEPGRRDTLGLTDIDEPHPGPGDLLVEVIAVGICGTDHEIIEGDIGRPADGRDRLTLGQQALAAAPGADLVGELVDTKPAAAEYDAAALGAQF